MNVKNFFPLLKRIIEERGLPEEKIWEVLEYSLGAAYKKEYGEKEQKILARIDKKSGEVNFFLEKQAVDKEMIFSAEELEKMKESKTKEAMEARDEDDKTTKKVQFCSERHILLKDAIKIKPDVKAGEFLFFPLKTEQDFGRIASQTAKQVFMQKIREVEKDISYDEYKTKEEQLVSGIIQRIEGRNIYVNLGSAIGILPREEQVPGEFYRIHQRLKFFVLKVEKNYRGTSILLSRAYPKLVSKLFELEVPEVAAGQVEVKSIAREPGSRTKISVFSHMERLDPVGAAVGQKGTRVQAVINELGGEKIDIIEYSEDPLKYISNALSPAKVLNIKLGEKNTAIVYVPEDQLSLAIGKDGQNVRLGVKLTGWKIDVRPLKEGDIPTFASEEGEGSDGNTVSEVSEDKPADSQETQSVPKEEFQSSEK